MVQDNQRTPASRGPDRRVDAHGDLRAVPDRDLPVLLAHVLRYWPGQVAQVVALPEPRGAVFADGKDVVSAVVGVRRLRITQGVFCEFLSLRVSSDTRWEAADVMWGELTSLILGSMTPYERSSSRVRGAIVL